MKISRHYRAFMERFGYLELPAIGRFEVISHENNEIQAAKKITFLFNPKAIVDNSLVEFLCEQLKSEACVIYSDIQYFSSSVKELLLQGLEAEIPGIGFLNIVQQNKLLFSHHSCYNEIPQQKIRKTSPAIMNISFWL